MVEYSDSELIEIYRNPETQHYGFNLIADKYKERLYWHIRKIVIVHDDADDVLQNTLIKAWNGLKSFREQSGLYTWLYKIATNESITHLNKKRTRYLVPIVNVEKELSNSLEADPWFDGNELQKKLQKSLLKLPEKQRIVFNLRYFEEMPYEEMSKILQTSEGALKASFHHAMKKLEIFLKDD
jgi:RNA polymerase sigma-70 factor (ECF subfamily)